MVIKRRIETAEAASLRRERRELALPGGSHDRLVRFLYKALPIAIGIVAAFMVITPLSPRGELSFLLDRNRVAMIDERLSVSNAMYRGEDDKGHPFSLTAGEAVQRSSKEGIVRMRDLVARIALTDGPARIWARKGTYQIDKELVRIAGPLRFKASDGYWMIARNVELDIAKRELTGSRGVEGAVPAGSFSADSLQADLDARTVALVGNARLSMIPGKLRMPKP